MASRDRRGSDVNLLADILVVVEMCEEGRGVVEVEIVVVAVAARVEVVVVLEIIGPKRTYNLVYTSSLVA